MRFHLFLSIAILSAMLLGCTTSTEPDKEQSAAESATEKKIDDILSKLTLKQKVGQMTQLTLDVLCKGNSFDANKEMELDSAKLRKVIVEYGVGSILNTGMYTLPQDQWREIITEIQRVALEEAESKIPVIYGVDAIHGCNYTVGATLFPQELATAATWDPKHSENCGAVTAYELRAAAIPWNFSPVLDLGRQPLWSRFFETFGEDPYLATVMGDAMVKGYQGDDVSDPEKVAACLKHYMGYSNSKSGKDRTPIKMSDREMREYYMVTFKSAIANGAQTVMINSTEINGVPVHASKKMLTDILKVELGFDGFAVTDWEDILMLHNTHKVAKTEKEAVGIAINAGVDMSMVPMKLDFADHLVALVNEGVVPMERIDDAVRRILRVKFRLGLFDEAIQPKENYKKFGSPEFADMSYQAALESVTLLKNDEGVLPLTKDKKVLVTGVGGHSLNALNGAWTHTWQGLETKYNTKGKKTIFEAVSGIVGDGNATYVLGTGWEADSNTAEAVAASKSVDHVIICLGEQPATEKPGDIEDLSYPQAQLDLVRQIASTGKPITLVLLSSRPRLIREVEPLVSSVIDAYWPGDEGGRAIAETIFGDNNPSGKLPFTYPRYSGSLVTYDHKFSEEKDKNFGTSAFNPQYEFGSGLSYTTFEYSDLKLSADTITGDDVLEVSVTVSNTGEMDGKEVVMLFSSDLVASITPSVKRLRRFEKIDLKAGASSSVTFKISRKELAFVSEDLKWITEPGDFDVLIGGLKGSFYYK